MGKVIPMNGNGAEKRQASLLQVAAGELGQLAPGTQAVELGLLAFVGREAQLGDRAAARGVVELGIAGQPADQGDPVDRRTAGLAPLSSLPSSTTFNPGLLRGIWFSSVCWLIDAPVRPGRSSSCKPERSECI